MLPLQVHVTDVAWFAQAGELWQKVHRQGLIVFLALPSLHTSVMKKLSTEAETRVCILLHQPHLHPANQARAGSHAAR